LADLRSVQAAAEEFNSKERELHVLFNNCLSLMACYSGVMIPPIEPLTEQRYNLQAGTNVLGHFYFTELLMSALLTGAKSSPDGKARVVNTSSFASLFASAVYFDTLQDTEARVKKGTMMLYCQSKLVCLINTPRTAGSMSDQLVYFRGLLFANELARRYGDKGVVLTFLNPGNLDSDLLCATPRRWSQKSWYAYRFILKTVSFGDLTQLWAGTSQEGAQLNGRYLIPWARVANENPAENKLALAQEIWEWMEEKVVSIQYSIFNEHCFLRYTLDERTSSDIHNSYTTSCTQCSNSGLLFI
ncbi:hypothetical protein HYPSUDRAFT_140756, partial [Hypholoma sublateritium FD-334 SS-4]